MFLTAGSTINCVVTVLLTVVNGDYTVTVTVQSPCCHCAAKVTDGIGFCCVFSVEVSHRVNMHNPVRKIVTITASPRMVYNWSSAWPIGTSIATFPMTDKSPNRLGSTRQIEIKYGAQTHHAHNIDGLVI